MLVIRQEMDYVENSKVIDYKGECIRELKKEEGILTVEIDLKKQEMYRNELPVLEQM